MNNKKLSIELDRILPYLMPTKNGTEKKRPTPQQRQEQLGAEDASHHRDVPLSLCLKWGDGELIIGGTADGVSIENGAYIVEEEMFLSRPIDEDEVREQVLLRGQLLCLALANTKSLSKVGLRLFTFVEGRVGREDFIWEKSALSHILTCHAPKLFALAPLWEKPEPIIEFPHSSLRQGQKQLIHAAWNAITQKTKLYACAPTGIGKTLAVLYPALRALEKGKAERIFYASPKNTLKQQAADAVELLQKTKSLRCLVLSAKMTLCPERKEDCDRALCPYAADFYEKRRDAVIFLSAFATVTEKELSAAARRFQICPFLLAKEMLPFSQVVIGDYNHIFDPTRALVKANDKQVLLIDEAHNLPTRVRENFTQTLCPEDFDPLFRDPTPPAMVIREHCSELLALFPKLAAKRKETKQFHSFEKPEEAGKAVKALLPKISFALRDGFGVPTEETRFILQELFIKVKKFAYLFDLFDSSFATVYPPEGGIRIYLVDPREEIYKASASWRSVIFFSATLSPDSYYFDILAGEDKDEFLTLDSPFPKENLFVGLCGVDVSYNQRFATATKLCNIIHTAVSVKKGNYMVFLPSFEYMNLVAQEYKRRNFHHRLLLQERVMTANKRSAFLEEFEKEHPNTLIGFCVLGGIFAEGVDLKGNSLSGEIIVGTGFPPPSAEAEAECESYYKREMDGKSFAYTLPGFSRVLQAAGRVIRSEEDRGFLILCDMRFLGEDIKELFPTSWEDATIISRESELREKLTDFWK